MGNSICFGNVFFKWHRASNAGNMPQLSYDFSSPIATTVLGKFRSVRFSMMIVYPAMV